MGSTPEVGSSRKRIGGRCRIAQPRASRCFHPPERMAVAVAIGLQAGHFDDPLLPLGLLFRTDAIDAGVEVDVLLDGQVLVERELLAHVADVGLDFLGLRADVEAGDAAAAAGRRQDPAEHADRRRFARSIGPQETKDLAAVDLEADLVHRHEAAEAALELVDADGDGLRKVAGWAAL